MRPLPLPLLLHHSSSAAHGHGILLTINKAFTPKELHGMTSSLSPEARSQVLGSKFWVPGSAITTTHHAKSTAKKPLAAMPSPAALAARFEPTHRPARRVVTKQCRGGCPRRTPGHGSHTGSILHHAGNTGERPISSYAVAGSIGCDSSDLRIAR
jgi:hypothetical protein